MFIQKSSNPVLSQGIFNKTISVSGEKSMTLSATINKSILSFLLLLAGAVYSWSKMFGAADTSEAFSLLMPYIAGGAIGGLILALLTIFKKSWSPYTVPVYAVLEGLFIGGISAAMEMQFSGQGIVFRAVSLTFGTFFAMLFLYRSGIIKVTNKFRLGIVAATGGIALVYLISWIMSMFGMGMGLLYGNSLMSIAISLFVVGIAALNLVLDFDFIDKASRANAPAYMEWYGAFGLMLTLIWLYLEILRLLAKLASRN